MEEVSKIWEANNKRYITVRPFNMSEGISLFHFDADKNEKALRKLKRGDKVKITGVFNISPEPALVHCRLE